MRTAIGTGERFSEPIEFWESCSFPETRAAER
jgi:hypothetical protein